MVYIACEELNFLWHEQDVEKVKRLWRQGHDIRYIAKAVSREVDEVVLLVFDLARRGRLKPRPRGVFGETEVEDESKGT